MKTTHCVDSNGVPYQVFGDDKRKRKPRPNKHKRLLNALLEHIKVEFGNLVIGDIFISMDDKTTKEIIKIKDSMK